MRRLARIVPFVAAAAGAAACSQILNLQPPPTPSGSTADSGGGAEDTGAAEASAPLCPALDAGDGGATYASLADSWTFFDTNTLPTKATAGQFAGGAFDGRYVYFAPSANGLVVRVDTSSSADFTKTAAWSTFDTMTIPGLGASAPRAFAGAAFDGRFVYFVPHAATAAFGGVVARYEVSGEFTSAAAWSTFDMSTLSADGGPSTKGFSGAVSDGRYLYFVPFQNDAGPYGRVVRFDTTPVDAGVSLLPTLDAGLDAGPDTGAPSVSTFALPNLWSTFDIASASSAALGFVGGAFDGTWVYFVPDDNGGPVNAGLSAVLARYRADASFAAASNWTSIDMTTMNGLAFGFSGGAFDGRYLYFVPHGRTVALRYDTRAARIDGQTAWSAYDVSRQAPDAASVAYYGAAFDGRFVYLVPSAAGFGTVVRYDTLGTFDADCAWSSLDLTQTNPAAAGYTGAVFDGEFLYLLPHANGVVARFDARTPAALPALPAFHGSFY